MKFSMSNVALLVSSALVSGAIAAQSTNDLGARVMLAKTQHNLLLQQQAKQDNTNLLTKGHYDSALSAKAFHWNNGTIETIPLNKSTSVDAQYRSAFDQYFGQIATIHGANKWSVSHAKMDKLHNTGRGGLIAQYSQEVDGVEVFGRRINILINRNNEYIASSGYFATANQKTQEQYSLSNEQALAIAFGENTGYELPSAEISQLKQNADFAHLTKRVSVKGYQLTDNSRIKKVFFPLENDRLQPAYYVEAETTKAGSKDSSWFSYVVDGVSGKVLFKNNLTAHATTTYKVFADDTGVNIPFDGPQGNQLSPHPTGDIADTPARGAAGASQNTITLDHGPISTMDPWLTDSEVTTAGNNVDSYADISGGDGFDADDIRPGMTGPNAFEYDFAEFSAGLAGDPQKHSVVSLFYVNNFLHDWFYDNGFDEAAGF